MAKKYKVVCGKEKTVAVNCTNRGTALKMKATYKRNLRWRCRLVRCRGAR